MEGALRVINGLAAAMTVVDSKETPLLAIDSFVNYKWIDDHSAVFHVRSERSVRFREETDERGNAAILRSGA